MRKTFDKRQAIYYNVQAMRDWRNRQTRTFKGRVGDRVSSSLTSRTKKRAMQLSVALFFCVRGCCESNNLQQLVNPVNDYLRKLFIFLIFSVVSAYKIFVYRKYFYFFNVYSPDKIVKIFENFFSSCSV